MTQTAEQPALLPRRWHKVNLDPAQLRYHRSTHRFNVVAAGRRAYKTEGAKRRVIRAALNWRGRKSYYDDGSPGQFFACAPTHQQSKDIFWRDLKSLVPNWALLTGDRRKDISESELTIELRNNAIIKVAGLDRPQRIEGGFWDGGVISEFADTKPDLLEAHIYPMMIAGGWIDLEGVPEGRNHYYDIFKAAQADKTGEWATHHWKTADVLWRYLGHKRADAEIHAAKLRMDPLVYAQEYEADFINFTGRAYYNFDQFRHARFKLNYDPSSPLLFCFDFNESPGVAVVCQEGKLPKSMNKGRSLRGTRCIGEVYIPVHSKTPHVCNRLIKDWGQHKGRIYLYGDATGGAGGSAKVEGSDWDLVDRTLRKHFGGRITSRVPRGNPAERSRVNAVNSRLVSANHAARLAVCPKSCPNLVRDLEATVTIEGGSGELDKKTDKTLTHISDALGYYVVKDFPVQGKTDFEFSQQLAA